MMLSIVSVLHLAAPLRFVHSPSHGIGNLVSVHDNRAVDVSRRPPHRLDERRIGTKESFLVSVENRYEGHLRHVQPFAQQIDADEDVEYAGPQVADDFGPLDRRNIRMEIADEDAHFL